MTPKAFGLIHAEYELDGVLPNAVWNYFVPVGIQVYSSKGAQSLRCLKCYLYRCRYNHGERIFKKN